MIVHKTPAFNRKFRKLTNQQREDFYKAIRVFYEDPFHSRLKTHKLKGDWKSFWAFRVNYSDRCIFSFIDNEEVLLYDIGSHDIYE